ncbi:discoidin domain-containing protein [Streptomyces hirsutus]
MSLGLMLSSAADGDGGSRPRGRLRTRHRHGLGEPFTGTDARGEVRGFVDAHNHLMSNEAFGGRLICGRPFSEKGIADALKHGPEHDPDGSLAIFDFITNGGDGRHDPDGWPTFVDWPAHHSLTQQNYYAWGLNGPGAAGSGSW